MPNSPRTAKARRESYPLHQCVLFKVGSKRRLSEILRVDLKVLVLLSKHGNYNVFEIKARVCEFTGKVIKSRWVQNPDPDLKALHRRIQTLLARVEVPDFCHGAVKGKSYRSNAAAHMMAPAAATFDLKSFFPSTTSAQVFGFYRNDLQCAPDVAGLLTELCTYRGALATGSPVSPILAYWANHRLFGVLQQRAADHDLRLSVYVDDVTLSGESLPSRIVDKVDRIVRKHGHQLSGNKTKLFGVGRPKHITGVVIANGGLQVPHSRLKKARAIQAAAAAAVDDEAREKLTAKLGGLLGEAAFIDARHRQWVRRTYDRLAIIKARRNMPAP